jgi:hypothetical protein
MSSHQKLITICQPMKTITCTLQSMAPRSFVSFVTAHYTEQIRVTIKLSPHLKLQSFIRMLRNITGLPYKGRFTVSISSLPQQTCSACGQPLLIAGVPGDTEQSLSLRRISLPALQSPTIVFSGVMPIGELNNPHQLCRQTEHGVNSNKGGWNILRTIRSSSDSQSRLERLDVARRRESFPLARTVSLHLCSRPEHLHTAFT